MICIIGSETTKNYGLFNDVLQQPDIRVVYTKPPFGFGTIIWKVVRRLKQHFFGQVHVHMAWEKTVLKRLDSLDRIIVVDTALRWLELSFLEKCREIKPNLQIDCFLLNSTNSMAFSEFKIQSKFSSFSWSSILTFDPHDSQDHNWHYIGLHYYSRHFLPPSHKLQSDLFFAGSIMGQRGKQLLRLLDCFNENHVNCCFLFPRLYRKQFSSGQPKGMQLLRKRISYKRMLKKMMGCNCILEVLQEGQRGSSLRYFEAVCYNKKLLTTNAEIMHYPFYDERYMKVFSSESDIDYDWVKKVETINYGYQDEFSPVDLFCTPTKNNKPRNP